MQCAIGAANDLVVNMLRSFDTALDDFTDCALLMHPKQKSNTSSARAAMPRALGKLC